MNEQGLAQVSNGQQMLEQIIAALMQGITPEQLIGQGVPQEMIQQAMAIIAQQTKQPAMMEGGLVAMSTQRGNV